MTALTAVHLTDIHEDVAMIEAATQIAEMEGADVAYITGDFIGKNHTSKSGNPTIDDIFEQNGLVPNKEKEGVLQNILRKHNLGNIKSFDDIPDVKDREIFSKTYVEQMTELQRLEQIGKQEGLQKELVGVVEKAYEALKPSLQKLASKSRIVGVLGNHDLTIGYDVLKDIVDFAELKDEVNVEGKNGTHFKIKGTINSYEQIGTYNSPAIAPALSPYFINYAQGDPNMNDPEVAKVQQAEYDRLNKTGDADILLTHVQPVYKPFEHAETDKKKMELKRSHGEAVEQFANQVGSIYGGHYHDWDIVVRNGVPSFRPGTNHVFVYKYDDKKEVESVKIYRVR